MSDIQRYTVDSMTYHDKDDAVLDGEIVIVEYDDHIAEVVRLRREADALKLRIDYLEARNKDLMQEDWDKVDEIKADGIQQMVLDMCAIYDKKTDTVTFNPDFMTVEQIYEYADKLEKGND